MTDLLRRRAAQFPASDAVVCPGREGDRSLSFTELDDLSDRLAAGLAGRWGFDPGTSVAWSLGASEGIEALVLYHAVLKARWVNVPVSQRLTRPETQAIIRDADCRAFIAADHNMLGWAADCGLAEEHRVPVADLLSDALAPSDRETADFVAGDAALEDDLAAILYTSGTTGRPKGVEHTHASALAAGIGWADAFRLGASDVLQSPFPIVSGAALHFNGLSALWAGATFVVDGVDVADALARIERWHTTVYVAVPSIYQYWLASPARSDRDLSSLRLLDYGGSSMPLPVIEALRSAFPDVGLMQTYGLTEAGPGGTYLPEEFVTSRLGSIGSRAAGRFTRFRVVRPDGSDVGPGEPGEFVLRGPAVMRGYHGDPAATDAAFLDGWLRSGDVVKYDDDGFLYFVDRLKDIIVRGGYNVSTVEVESVLLAHRCVMDAAVVGVPHRQLGETVAAAVVLAADCDVTPDELIGHCAQSLADYKLPGRIALVSELPRNSTGKIIKAAVRDAIRSAGPSPRSRALTQASALSVSAPDSGPTSDRPPTSPLA